METPETLNISPKDFNIIKDYLVTEWNKGVLESIPCQCGKKKDVRYQKAFCFGYKGSKRAYIRFDPFCFVSQQLQVPWRGETYELITHVVFQLILEIVKDELNITSVDIKSPGDCGCANVPPRIINNPDPYIF